MKSRVMVRRVLKEAKGRNFEEEKKVECLFSSQALRELKIAPKLECEIQPQMWRLLDTWLETIRQQNDGV